MISHQRYPLLAAVAFLISACGGNGGSSNSGNGDTTAPLPPALAGTLPHSPNQHSTPSVLGTAEPGAMVQIYREQNCAGPVVGFGLADGLGAFFAVVFRPVFADAIDDVTTDFTATAADAAGNVSNCSAALSYIATPIPQVDFAAPSPFDVGASPTSVAVGDLDGDGDLDLVAANSFDDNVSVLLGKGDGTFAAGAVPPVTVGTTPQSVAIADLNGDGDLDFVTANFNSDSVSVRLGNGDGTFVGTTNPPVGNGPASVAIGDLDGDSNPDIAVANAQNDNISVLLGDGNGTFAGAVNFVVGDNPRSVAIGDLDGDGVLDIVTANSITPDGSVSVLLGDGIGAFGSAANFDVGDRPVSVAIGDLDSDGALDIVAANETSGDVSVLLGDGNGSFAPAAESPINVGNELSSVAIGFLNGDGRPDLAVANVGDDNVWVRLGEGDGTFAPATDSPFDLGAGTNPNAIAVGDLDGDGRPDLVTANNLTGSDDTVSVLLNQGSP